MCFSGLKQITTLSGCQKQKYILKKYILFVIIFLNISEDTVGAAICTVEQYYVQWTEVQTKKCLIAISRN